jgi:TetR/AcrR family fatty acid metabolism transcriptional regulator
MIKRILEEGGVRDVNIRIFRNMFLGAFTHMALRWFLAQSDKHFDKLEEMKEVASLLSNAVWPAFPAAGSNLKTSAEREQS